MHWRTAVLLLLTAAGTARTQPPLTSQWDRQGPAWAEEPSASGPPANMPRVTRVDVVCGKQHMTVHLQFNQPFYGLVFSKGKFSEQQCIYVPANTGQSRYTFDVRYDACGTKPDLHGNFYENTVVIQYGADVIEAWDEAKRLRCEWHEAYEKSAAQPPPIQLADLDVVELNFQGDSIDCWMEIQEGKGPWSREVSGLVPLGSPLTMVVAVNDAEGQFDMRVKSCFAHDGHNVPVQLTDEWGCVLRPKMLSPFNKVRDYNGRASVVSYSHFYAFKFPDTMDVHVQCKVEVCRHGCPDSCQKTQYQAINPDGRNELHQPYESKKVTVKASTRNTGVNKPLSTQTFQLAESRPPAKTHLEINSVPVDEDEEPVPEPIPGEGAKGRIVPPKAVLQQIQEIKQHESFKIPEQGKLFPGQPFATYQEIKQTTVETPPARDAIYPIPQPPIKFQTPPLQFQASEVHEVLPPAPEPEPQAVFQPVNPPHLISAASTINQNHKQPGQLLLGKNPRSESKHNIFQGATGNVSPQKQPLQRFNPAGLYKPPKPHYPYPIPQFVPPQPLFVQVVDRTDPGIAVYRQASHGQPETFLKIDDRTDPASVVYRQPNNGPPPEGFVKFGFPQGPRSIRLKRSAADGEEIGVQQVYHAVANVDLAFEPNATVDGATLYSGRQEEIVYGVCLPVVNLAVGLGFLLLMSVLSLCVCGYLAYQFRLQAMLKNSQTLLTAKQQPGGRLYFLYRNRAAAQALSSVSK